MARLERLTIQGFRSFGEQATPLEFNAPLTMAWGPNSEGKTSLAEALEFLFTGETARRELLASEKAEFANALRNAHMPAGADTFVEGHISHNGKNHVLRRTLVSDYAKRKSAVSTLTLDGTEVDEGDLSKIGVQLSEPPTRAPILMQHTLSFLLSAQPKERSLYFKRILDVEDLEQLRSTILGLETDSIDSPLLQAMDALLDEPQLKDIVCRLDERPLSETQVRGVLAEGTTVVLKRAGLEAPDGLDAKRFAIESALEARRAATFPIMMLEGSPGISNWNADAVAELSAVVEYRAVASDASKEEAQLVALFKKVLEYRPVSEAMEPVDCPVCETTEALTPDRVEQIRRMVRSRRGIDDAAATAREQVQASRTSVVALKKSVNELSPDFASISAAERRTVGFRIDRFRELVSDSESTDEWITTAKDLLKAKRTLDRSASATLAAIDNLAGSLLDLKALEAVQRQLHALEEAHDHFRTELGNYRTVTAGVAPMLKESVDQKIDGHGWRDLVRLAEDPSATTKVLLDRHARRLVEDRLAKAIKQIESAKERVLGDKFADLSDDVKKWWDLLRPAEPSFFSDLRPRPGTQRTIDFKAGLSISPDRRSVQVRDAIAVFSQSQIQCLGIATFLARNVSTSGFVVMDDPVISMDDDYSVHFIEGVLGELVKEGVQVIVITHEQRTAKAVEVRYGDGTVEAYELTLDDPAVGTEVTKKTDALAQMIHRAKPFTRSSSLEIRRQGCEKLRNCAERFCKEFLVSHRRLEGDETAMVTDYSGKTGGLGHLIDECAPYLTGRDEEGKLRMLKDLVNPGNHDDSVPSKTFLATSLGTLKELQNKYLRN